MTCAGCHKSLSGQYLTALGQNWHAACFRCVGCGQIIEGGGFVEKNNQPYHANCHQEAFGLRCSVCSKFITGSYVDALGKIFHTDCFRCAGCQKTIGEQQYLLKENQPYHEKCYHERFTPKCQICTQPLTSTYVINAWNEQYCNRHQDEFSKCFSCSRLICEPLTGGGTRYPDDHCLCGICLQTVIETEAQGQPLLDKVKNTLTKLGLDVKPLNTPLRLTDQIELDRFAGNAQHPTGVARSKLITQDDREVERKIEEILVLRGISDEHFMAVVAHELGHAWLFLNRIPKLNAKSEEGFCELSSYLWLKERGTPQANYHLQTLEKNEDPIYGAGFQIARQAWQKQNFDLTKLINHIHQTGKL